MRIAPIVKEFQLTANEQTGYNAYVVNVVHNMGRTPFRFEAMMQQQSTGLWWIFRSAREFTLYGSFLGIDVYPTSNNPNSVDVQFCASGLNNGNNYPVRLRLYFM